MSEPVSSISSDHPGKVLRRQVLKADSNITTILGGKRHQQSKVYQPGLDGEFKKHEGVKDKYITSVRKAQSRSWISHSPESNSKGLDRAQTAPQVSYGRDCSSKFYSRLRYIVQSSRYGPRKKYSYHSQAWRIFGKHWSSLVKLPDQGSQPDMKAKWDICSGKRTM